MHMAFIIIEYHIFRELILYIYSAVKSFFVKTDNDLYSALQLFSFKNKDDLSDNKL
jgi:hypothetical protein